MKRCILILATVLLALTAGSTFGIYISNCPQLCTPSCPCSIQCQGPFGPTTCGQAGEACTNFASNPETESETVLFDSFEDLLKTLETGETLPVALEEPTEQHADTAEETSATDAKE